MNKLIPFNRLVVFFIGCGYLALSFEIFIQHSDVLQYKKIAWTPIIFGCTGGFITILVSIFFNKLSYYFFMFVMLVSVFVGFLGLYLHNRWRYVAFSSFLQGKPFDFEVLTTYTPLLAPSAFIAMGTLGILVCIYFSWSK